jgi:hypothetical protein
MTNRELIDEHLMAALLRKPIADFCTGTLGDTLLSELEDSWDLLPETTKAVMLGVAAEMKRHYANSIFSDMMAAQFVGQFGLKK